MVRAVRPYFSLHKITFKYNLHTTNKFLDWAKKKMNSNKYHFCTIKQNIIYHVYTRKYFTHPISQTREALVLSASR